MFYKDAEKEFIADFIEAYRGLPALWDVKCKDYKDRAKKAEQYDVLLEKYREKYPDANKQEVVKKINSLRTNFRKELKRIRETEGYVEPSLWYFANMRFLVTLETPTASISNKEIMLDDAYDEDRMDMNNTSDCTVDDESRESSRKRKGFDNTRELMKLSTKRILQPTHQASIQPTRDDDKITAAWAVELRTMAPQQRLFAKKAINDILFEGQMGTLHRNSVQINAIPGSSPYNNSATNLSNNPTFRQHELADNVTINGILGNNPTTTIEFESDRCIKNEEI